MTIDMSAKKQGLHWTREDERELRDLARHNTPTRLIAWELDRTVDGVRSKASDLGLSLKPTNQRPYGRRS